MKNISIKLALGFMVINLCLSPMVSLAQKQDGVLSIETCYQLARVNYPLIKQQELLAKAKDLSLDNAQKTVLPQVQLAGQATYQSDVTGLPISIPNMEVPSLNKGQYKVFAELTQSLTALLILKDQKEQLAAQTAVDNQKLEVELYKIHDRINNLYFGILLLDKQLSQIQLSKQDIQQGIDKIETAIKNGVALKSSVNNLKAELLQVNQRIIGLQYDRRTYVQMLSSFIKKELAEDVQLSLPASMNYVPHIARPEQTLFQLQRDALSAQTKLIDAKTLPQLSVFVQSGVGNPGLNMLKAETQGFYIAGLKLGWNLNNFYTQKNDKSLVETNQRLLAVQEEAFVFNTEMEIAQQEKELEKLKLLHEADKELIQLREQVKNSTLNQLNYGSANTSDYILDLHAVEQAKQNQAIHEIQILMANYKLQIISGIPSSNN